MLHRRPDLNVVDLRGNVETRLRKLRDQDLDAIVLARAGLERLGLGGEIAEVLDPEWMLPAVGQGAIGLECRADDAATRQALEAVADAGTWAAVRAERAMLWRWGAGVWCRSALDTAVEGGTLTLRGAVLSADGTRRVAATRLRAGPAGGRERVGGAPAGRGRRQS